MNVPIVPMNLVKTTFESEHVPALFSGEHTHDPALRLVAQLVKSGADDDHVTQIVTATLPPDYSGDTLKELPDMITGARRMPIVGDSPVSQLGYQMTSSGLVLTTKERNAIIETFVSGPFEIVGLVRDKESGGWAKMLKWVDRDGHPHQYIASDKDLLSDHDLVCGELASGGLPIGKGKQVKLADYILSQDTTARVTLVTQTGWHCIKTANIFALPRLIVGSPPEPVVYEGADAVHNEFGSSGSLADWKREVAGPAGDHVLGVLAISAALAAPLLHLAGIESGGIHLFGNSSTGKTTLLKCAASVWGDSGLVHSWRATANGLEGIANRANDVVLILDELGQIDSKEASTAVYMLATGVGKIRMNRNATLKDIKTWRAFMLSSGEMTLEQKISQLRGATAFTGATLRLLNIAANREYGYGAFDHAGPTGNTGDMVKALSTAAARYYGVAGVEFVTQLIERPDIGERVRAFIDDFMKKNVERGSDGQLERAAKRFGLVAAAGELATEFGVTGWRSGVANEAAAATLEKWAALRGGDGKEPAEDRRAILHVTSLIVTYGESRFDELDEDGFPPTSKRDVEGEIVPAPRHAQTRIGWRKGSGENRIWLIDDSKWETEVCKGFDPLQVSKALARHGLLKHARGRFTYAERFEGKRNKRFHVITHKILERDYDSTEADAPDDDDGYEEPQF